jgi:hypothetical protein
MEIWRSQDQGKRASDGRSQTNTTALPGRAINRIRRGGNTGRWQQDTAARGRQPIYSSTLRRRTWLWPVDLLRSQVRGLRRAAVPPRRASCDGPRHPARRSALRIHTTAPSDSAALGLAFAFPARFRRCRSGRQSSRRTSKPRITKGVGEAAPDRGATQGGYSRSGHQALGPQPSASPPSGPLPLSSRPASPKTTRPRTCQVTMPGVLHAARLTTGVGRRTSAAEARREDGQRERGRAVQ